MFELDGVRMRGPLGVRWVYICALTQMLSLSGRANS